MPLHNLAILIDIECNRPRTFRDSPVPSARTGTAGLLCRLQGCFGIGMGNPSAGVFGLSYRPTRHKTRLIVLARPNVIRYLGYRRDKENGVMGVHGSKDKISMCQTAAASTVHVHRAGPKCTGWTEWTEECAPECVLFGVGPEKGLPILFRVFHLFHSPCGTEQAIPSSVRWPDWFSPPEILVGKRI